jgi:hypothetical protein
MRGLRAIHDPAAQPGVMWRGLKILKNILKTLVLTIPSDPRKKPDMLSNPPL